LRRIDGKGYKAYRDIRGAHRFDFFDLHVDRVQSDPFAAPSKLRLRVPMEEAALPRSLHSSRVRRVALADYLARRVRDAIRRATGGRSGSGKSGLVHIDAGGQEVLERTAIVITDAFVEARIEVGLPAAGRRVRGRQAEALLCEALPEIAEYGLLFEHVDEEDASAFVECVENQEHIRARLDALGLIAFVADGAILPRESGASERPMAQEEARPFSSPDSHRVTLELPNPVHGSSPPTNLITGMGLRKGVSLIVGGGYHGKSTLLRALECCVHPHIPGDGREYVVASGGLVKIRAEDGRAVSQVDIHAFISELPAAFPDQPGRSTRAFSSDDASGSTSQAAAIAEAMEVGATGLLLDEDTSATNFMLRDARMQRLVHREHEPITPFVDRVREIYEQFGVSTVLVMGGSGDYFDVADTVIMMRDYAASDATDEARRIATDHETGRVVESREAMQPITPRIPWADGFSAARGRRDVKISAKSREAILYGEQAIDVRHVSQLLDTSQTRAVAFAIHLASERLMGGERKGVRRSRPTLAQVLDGLDAFFDAEGLDGLDPYREDRSSEAHPGSFARPRRYEIAAALNRMRSLEMDLQGD
jgi:predicted ABC-class ATPase